MFRQVRYLLGTVMKKATLVMISAAVLFLAGCSAAMNNYSKTAAGMLSGNYKVTVWSGGQAVAVYHVKDSFVNTEQNSDGWFFFVDGKLIRVSGTVTVEQQ